MVWLIGMAIVALVIVFLAKSYRNGVPTIRQHTRSARERAKLLSDSEKDKFSAEVRALAIEQYDMASTTAKDIGKGEAFAHQAGILRAVSAVVVQGKRIDPDREKELQMETVPFNKLPPDEGKHAVAEYLVYKFFPDKADESAFSPALSSFKRQMLADAEKQSDPDGFMFDMIYCLKYDWQRYIAAMQVSGE